MSLSPVTTNQSWCFHKVLETNLAISFTMRRRPVLIAAVGRDREKKV